MLSLIFKTVIKLAQIPIYINSEKASRTHFLVRVNRLHFLKYVSEINQTCVCKHCIGSLM